MTDSDPKPPDTPLSSLADAELADASSAEPRERDGTRGNAPPTLDSSKLVAPPTMDSSRPFSVVSEDEIPSTSRHGLDSSSNHVAPKTVNLETTPELLEWESDWRVDSPIAEASPVSAESSVGTIRPGLSLRSPLAHGGMGEVLRGRDEKLGRELAVKVLLSRHADRPTMINRFLEEAQITGQLQHPGIVPIHEFGRLPDQRPYFTMKLVKGRTLFDLLRARRGLADRIDHFLGIFESICQTMAYAHSRRVIHRDLKTTNIMVGSFGEVQVMDWGLAKVLKTTLPSSPSASSAVPPTTEPATSAPGPSPSALADSSNPGPVEVHASSEHDPPFNPTTPNETRILTLRSENRLDQSVAGDVMGTPAYMPPEQARGEIERLDERADVFALGAILCEILTGRPPYVGLDSHQVYIKATLGKIDEAIKRLEQNEIGADPAWIALTIRCLAVEPKERPRDAQELARLVAEFRADQSRRLRQAELERAAEAARAESLIQRARLERDRRRLRMTIGLIVLVVCSVGGVVLYRQWVSRQIFAQELHEAEKVVQLAEQSRSLDTPLWADAQRELNQVQTMLGSMPPPDLKQRVDGLETRITAGRQRIRDHQRLLTAFRKLRQNTVNETNAKVVDQKYETLFNEIEFHPIPTDDAIARWVETCFRAEDFISALDDWLIVQLTMPTTNRDQALKRIDLLRMTLARLDPDPWRTHLRSLDWRRSDLRDQLRALADDRDALAQQPAKSLLLLGRYFHRIDTTSPYPEDKRRAVAVLKRAWQLQPNDYWINLELARAPGRENGNPKERFPDPSFSIPFLYAAIAASPHEHTAWGELAVALMVQGKTEEAYRVLNRAVELKTDSPALHNLSGVFKGERGQLEEAVFDFQKAVDLAPENPLYHANLAMTLVDLGRFEEAIPHLEVTIRRSRHEIPYIEYRLGLSLEHVGDLEAAIAYHLRTTKMFDEEHRTLATLRLFMVHARLGRVGPALEWLSQATRAPWRKLSEDSVRRSYQNDLERGWTRFADPLMPTDPFAP